MDYTMNFSAMTRLCHNLIKSSQTQQSATGATAFYEKLQEKSRETSLEEYKQYLYDKIESLSLHESNSQDSIAVHITDAGLEAMRNDPEYEKWVLDTLRANFRCSDPWSGIYGGKFSVFYFGATKEEYRGESWRMGFQNGREQTLFREKSEDSFWERRRRRRKELLEQQKELDEKKAIAMRMAKSEYYVQLSRIQAEKNPSAEPENYNRLAMEIFSSFKSNILLNPFHGKKA
ncbi:MAG: hypothetical protein NC318_09505 [Blautia sp.]|nr:hypothetical protein [Lachnoclostridium sp.]MCM1211826.1 hypothetical protein [Blautia sp.]